MAETGKAYAALIVKRLNGPIKTVDSYICTGLDYVEYKIQVMKLSPGQHFMQIYNSNKDMVVNNTIKIANNVVESIIHPVVEKQYRS